MLCLSTVNSSCSFSITETLNIAKQLGEPTLLNIPCVFEDDRGWSFMNMLENLDSFGQINFSHMHPGIVKAWHRHKKQTDIWIVVQGDLKIGVLRSKQASNPNFYAAEKAWSIVLGEHHPRILVIPPGLWHGCAVNTPYPAGLVYVVTVPYNLQSPDEERLAPSYFSDFSWGPEFK